MQIRVNPQLFEATVPHCCHPLTGCDLGSESPFLWSRALERGTHRNITLLRLLASALPATVRVWTDGKTC